MKAKTSSILTLAEKCKNILASNWQGNLNTVKADAKGSKGEIYTSKVKYFVRKGKPYIWVPEKDMHNVNAIIDERGSFAVASPFPGILASLFKSIQKLPSRVALTGDVVRLEKQVASVRESLEETISLEEKIVGESSYSVSGVLASPRLSATLRSENLKDLLEENEQYVIYKFNVSSCTYVDANGGTHEVEIEDFTECKSDPLSPFSTSLIDGINQSETRRRALILFCITLLKTHAKDAVMLSVDRKGFNILAKVVGPSRSDGSFEYRWKEFCITFEEEARHIEAFCERRADGRRSHQECLQFQWSMKKPVFR